MEKLSAAQQQQLKKMSNERLRLKLISAGYEEEMVLGMEREEMMITYAELLVGGKLKVSPVGYDPDLERERLAFEQKKWEAEMELRKQEVEERRQKEQREEEMRKQEVEERKQKEEREADDRKRREWLEGETLQLRKMEYEHQVARDKADKEKNERAVTKGKLFGDAMRASVIRMGADPIDLVAFLRNCEQLFSVYDVPESLQAILIRPFLNDRARTYITKLDPDISGDYRRLKEALLKEFKLSPNVYLERFNMCNKTVDETYVTFASKLTGYLSYYIDSRGVDSFDKLCELLVCDRIKSTLSDNCLRYVLSIESASKTGWLAKSELVDAIDRFAATHTRAEKPRAFAIGQTPQTVYKNEGHFTQAAKPFPPKFNNNGAFQQRKDGKNGAVLSGVSMRRCFQCGKTDHLRSSCPELNRGKASSNVHVKRVCVKSTVDSCMAERSQHGTCVDRDVVDSADRPGQAGVTRGAASASDASRAAAAGVAGSPANNSDSRTVASPVFTCCDSDDTIRGVANSVNNSGQFTAGAAVMNEQHVAMNVNACSITGLPRAIVHELSPLKYIDVCLSTGESDVIKRATAVCDTGAEICCVKANLCEELAPAKVGQIQLRPFCGKSVTADVVRLTMSCESDSGDESAIDIYCALVPELYDDLLLSADAIDRLTGCITKVSRVQTRSSDDNDNDKAEIDVSHQSASVTTRCDINANSDSSDVDDVTPTYLMDDDDDNNDVGVDDVTNPGVVISDATSSDVPNTDGNNIHLASGNEVASEQRNDASLRGCWKLADRNRGGFVVRDGLLYHRASILGQSFLQLVVPTSRREHVLKMGHDTFGGHMSVKRTKARISYTFYWPSLAEDCREYIKTCSICQKKARVTYRDRVPIKPIPRADRVFDHLFVDIAGPLISTEGQRVKYNYAFIAVDSFSRFPFCIPLKSLTAESVCNALLEVWQFTGCCSYISSDLGTNFTSKLTTEFEKRLGCSPRFNSPWHPNSTGLAERGVANVKRIIAKLAADHPKQWHTYLPMTTWCLREIPNETTGVAPWVLALGHLPRGPLAILKESWCGDQSLPVSFGKDATKYLRELHDKLDIAKTYATSHSEREQNRYAAHYNLRSRDKHFNVGDQVLILMPDSTGSRLFSKWSGPATVIEVCSPYSYIVELDGVRKHFHANKLRKFHVRVETVVCDSLIDDLDIKAVNTCATVNASDREFGQLGIIPTTLCQPKPVILPSQKIDRATISHLTDEQQLELLQVLDTYPECFSEVPGFTDVVEHKITLTGDFKPKRLRAYRIPERLKPEVDRQIQEMLQLGIIRPSESPMASPLVCVLKGKDGCDGVRLAVDYRYVNRFTQSDAYPNPDMSSVFQRIGRSKLISIADCKSGYWQLPCREEDKWLTAFICDAGLFEFNRSPFGLKTSGFSFIRAITKILRPIREFTDSFVDDVAVHSDEWKEHLNHISKFLQTIRDAGITLNLKKCRWAQSQVRFCGEVIGSGKRFADLSKVKVVHEMEIPQTKTELRRMLGFFSYFREHIANFAEVAKPLTDLTAKRIPMKLPWSSSQQRAFDELKRLLCKATVEPLHIVDFTQPFDLYVDASGQTVSSVLVQRDQDGVEVPVAFSSTKLSPTQQAWSTIEREAYAALLGLQKYRNWIFGSQVTVHSDHNPLLYLTESAPKSAKLMRWALGLQNFNVKFTYHPGRANVAADCLSRLNVDDDSEPDLDCDSK